MRSAQRRARRGRGYAAPISSPAVGTLPRIELRRVLDQQHTGGQAGGAENLPSIRRSADGPMALHHRHPLPGTETQRRRFVAGTRGDSGITSPVTTRSAGGPAGLKAVEVRWLRGGRSGGSRTTLSFRVGRTGEGAEAATSDRGWCCPCLGRRRPHRPVARAGPRSPGGAGRR
jgi:hypothetical protein